jgi:hypothetical protein
VAALAALVVATVVVAQAIGSAQGPQTASSAVDDGSTGSAAWSSPGDGKVSDDVYATAGLTSQASHYLKVTGFGFSIPSGSTITGVSVSVERIKTGSSQDVRDASVRLVKASSVAGSEHADTGMTWPFAADGTASYGSASDLWGTTLSPADVNGSGFGVAVSAQNLSATGSFAKIDSVSITVSYTSAAADGPRTAASAVDDGSTGSVAWSSPANGKMSDDAYATAGLTSQTSHYLKLTGFGFAIPTGSTITGVSVSVERIKTGSSQDVRDASVKLVKASSVVGTEHADAGTTWPYLADGTASYGSGSDLWGTTLSPADVNGSGFGVAVSAQNLSATGSFAKIDSVSITVTYTSGGGGGTAPSNSTAPGISGSATVGSTVSRVQGTWSGSTPITYAYQWRRCDSAGASCTSISGATGTSYVVASADLGKTLRVQETATNAYGFATATSAQTAVVTSGGATSWTATNYTRSVFQNPSTIPYTAWTGAWKDPHDGSLWVAFTESSGSQTSFAPSWVGTVNPARDHWALTNKIAYYQSTDHGASWNEAKPNNGADDLMRTWDPSVSSCTSTGTGSNCPTTHPIPFTPQATIALADGTLVRRVNGEDIGYDQAVEKTAFIQRLTPGAGHTWGAPEYLLDPTTCSCTYQISRIRRLSDGRLIALGQKWSSYDPKSGTPQLLLMVGDSTAHNWTVGLTGSSGFGAGEWDAAELPNHDLIAVFKTSTDLREQAILHQSGSGWTISSSDVHPTPFGASGHPELLETSSGAVLYLATVDETSSHEKGIWYLSNANAESNSTGWTLLPFANGDNGADCAAAGSVFHCSTRYYPRSFEDCVGGTCTIYVFSHTGSDDDYWEVNGHTGVTQVNESIILQKFQLTSP